MTRKTLVVALVLMLALTACTPSSPPAAHPVSPEEYTRFDVVPTSLGDPALLAHVEDSVEADLGNVANGRNQLVDNVDAIYYSKEYLEELAYNSKSSIYFGYTLAELEKQFEGQKYVFAPDGHGKTIAKPFDDYDDTYDQIIRNVAIGGGVILLCVTVAVVTPASGPTAAFSVIIAVSAKSAAMFAGSEALLNAIVAAVVTGVQTGDLEQALKAAGLAGSEGFLWGAIGGALIGGATALSALRGATRGGLTLNQAAEAQSAKLSLKSITRMRNGREVQIYKEAGLTGRCRFMNKGDLLRRIDLNKTGPDDRTNLQLMRDGFAPLDPRGAPYELHHIGQTLDAPLAILEWQEHRGGENNGILHRSGPSDVEHGAAWLRQRQRFWREFAAQAERGLLDQCLG